MEETQPLNQRAAPRPDNAIKRTRRARSSGTGPRWQQVAALDRGPERLRHRAGRAHVLRALPVHRHPRRRTPTSRPRPRTSTTPTASTRSARSRRRTARTSRSTRCPSTMQAAVIAAEDRTFYTNRGIDIRGIIRAARNNAQSGADHRRRLHDHPAVRQDPVPLAGAVVHPQGPRGDPVDQDPQPAEQAGDPRGLPQHRSTSATAPTASRSPRRRTSTSRPPSSTSASPPRSPRSSTGPSFYDPYAEGGADRMTPRYNYVLDGMAKAGAISAARGGRGQGQPARRSRSRRTTTASRGRTATCCDSCRSRWPSSSSATPRSWAAA